MKHLGDITKLSGYEVPMVDIVVGGSPCQDLSVAGKREGLSGERSGLFMEQIRIIKEMRERDRKISTNEFIRPRYMVWENVPGAFSSNKGYDFKAVLEETAKIADSNAIIPEPKKKNGKLKWSKSGCIVGDGWSIAWRVHDAQFWGVPQRRKRISLVADFGGQSAPEILFERKGLSGDIEESREEGQGTSTDIERSSDKASNRLNPWDVQSKSIFSEEGVCNSLCSGTTEGMNIQPCVLQKSKNYTDAEKCVDKASGVGLDVYNGELTGDVAATLTSACGGTNTSGAKVLQSAGLDTYNQTIEMEVAQPLRAADGGDTTPKVVCFEGNINKASGVVSKGNGECFLTEEKHMSLSTGGGQAGQGFPCVLENKTIYCVDQGGGKSQANVTENVSPTLTTTHQGEPAVLESISFQERAGKPGGGKGILIQNERTGALSTVNNQSVCLTYRKQGHPQNAEQGQGWKETEINDTLNAFDSGETRTPTLVLESHPQDSRVKIKEDGIVQTLDARMGMGGGNVPMVMEQPITASKASFFMNTNNDGKAETLVATDYKDPQLVAYGLDRASYNGGYNANFGFSVDEDRIGTQTASGPGAVCTNYIVRRLTPLECERLQGYPDGWTDIGDWIDSKGKKHKGDADSPRYKALGNSIALPFWQWMAERMIRQLNVEQPTMASLFDGIGGFPLVYSRCGCKPIWASEIEEFPIAVTKIRFPEDE